MQVKLPATAEIQALEKVGQQLIDQGYLAYLAGGSVRDLLLGRQPKDYDLATNASPERVEELFAGRTLPIGKKFGIIIVREGRFQFEVATFRTETDYQDNRRPNQVVWSQPQDDALRRDFTINALYYDLSTGKVLDYVDGQRDLEARLIRFVGNARERLDEDYLRLLRAIRLKNTLGFQYDAPTYRAIRQFAKKITQISAERIRDELNLMFDHPSRIESLRDMDELGILEVILPEITNLRGVPQPLEYHQEGDVFDHTVSAIASLPADCPAFVVWAVLLHDVGKALTLNYPKYPGDRIRFNEHKTVGAQLARQIGHRLRFPKVKMETIAWLVDHHMNLKGIADMRIAKQRTYLLDPRFKWLLEVHRADAAGTIPRDLSLYEETKKLYRNYMDRWQVEQKQGHPKPLVTGHDLQKQLGIQAGPQIGKLLELLKDAQLEGTIKTKSEALRLAKQHLPK